MEGSTPLWNLWGVVAYDVAAIPLLAALLFVMLILPRAALKDRLHGAALIVISLSAALFCLLLVTLLAAYLVPQIDEGAAIIRVFAAGLLLAAWLVPRELSR